MKTTDVLSDNILLKPAVNHELKTPDHEVQMARSELYRAGKCAMSLHNMLKTIGEEQGLEGWVQAKITKAADYLESVYHYLDYEMQSGEIDEAIPTITAAPTTVAAPVAGAAATTTAPPPAQAAVAAAQAIKQKKAMQAQVKQMQDAIKQAETNLINQKKQLTDLQKQMNQPMGESASAGASAAGGVASVAGGLGKKKSQVGSLFGGTYKQDESEKLDEMPPVRSIRRAHRSWVDQKKSNDRRSHGFVKSYNDKDVGPSKQDQQSEIEKQMQAYLDKGGVVRKPAGKVINVKEDPVSEIRKGEKDANGYTKCWPGKHAEGTKKGKNGGQVRNCVPNESVAESEKSDATWKVTYDYGPHQSNTIHVKAKSSADAWQVAKKEAAEKHHHPRIMAGQVTQVKNDVKEAANAAQQAAIAINMKKAGKKPKSEQEMEEGETGPKFTGYWKGTDKGKPGKKMVGSN